MSKPRIDLPRERIAAFCRRHGIRELRLFGSASRDDFRDDSDVDFLVEFEAGTAVGLLGIARMELELSELVGRKADLRTAGDLSRYFRHDVIDGSSVLYQAEKVDALMAEECLRESGDSAKYEAALVAVRDGEPEERDRF